MRWIFLIVLIAVVIALAPWQAVQNSWIVPAYGQTTIHWHDCLRGGGAQVSGFPPSWKVFGYTVENRQSTPLLVTACDR